MPDSSPAAGRQHEIDESLEIVRRQQPNEPQGRHAHRLHRAQRTRNSRQRVAVDPADARRNIGVAGAPCARPYAVGRGTRRRGSGPPADRRGARGAGRRAGCAR